MDQRQPPPPRNPSRTFAMVGVAVLLVIAIAGIVLATLQRGLPPDWLGAGDETQPASARMTEEGAPNQVAFAPDSAQLPSAANAKLLRLAEKVSKDKQSLTILGKIDARPDSKAQRMELARRRAIAVRGVVEANGVPLARMETRTEELASALGTATDWNRIEGNPR